MKQDQRYIWEPRIVNHTPSSQPCWLSGIAPSAKLLALIKIHRSQELLLCLDRDRTGRFRHCWHLRRQWDRALSWNALTWEVNNAQSKLTLGQVDYQAVFVQTTENLFQVPQGFFSWWTDHQYVVKIIKHKSRVTQHQVHQPEMFVQIIWTPKAQIGWSLQSWAHTCENRRSHSRNEMFCKVF